MSLSYLRTVPVLRSFDEVKAREFYCGFLGFTVDWEHRYELDLPLYMQVSRAGINLHISEHHGDATPGSAVRFEVKGLEAFHAELLAKSYKNMRPGIERQEYGAWEVCVIDPAGNKLIFCEYDEGRKAGDSR
ncbi:glyoxalase superfamily protein [Devosia nitrariae]|uniref:Bleomycin resistance protein n=1 Tax=Devosia nitrariae TaxID=2071872 RepID=A0ABQ5W3F8_9HYPH|nr:glyoxalase superfamily protein [Devosia nitrariae]GLQ54378.1 bleomycin resistance protein [Devosia nitrariae]